jgi:hypothetical protein
MNEDILLPVDLPAEALKLVWWQVSCLQALNDRFQSVVITGRANRECRFSTLPSHSQSVETMDCPRPWANGSSRPFSVTQLRIRNGSSCPIPDLRGRAIRRLPRVDFSRSALRPNDQKANISPTVTFGRIGTAAWSVHERQADLRFWKLSTADSGRRGSVRREHPLDLFRVSCLGQGQHE